MDLIERIKAHYDGLGRKRIEVPEWGDEHGPLVIYARPMTLREKNRIFGRAEKGASLEALADLVILKAEDEEGRKLFRPEDRLALITHAEADVIARVAAEISAVDSVEDHEKN